jgi:hypothetical protein
MNRIRWMLVTLVLVSMMTIAGARATSAQGATPISIPTPTSAGCDQIPAYVEDREKIMNDLMTGLAAIFPDVGTPVADHGDELLGAMMAMTPEQTGKLGELYDDLADKLEKLDAPEIAQFYNEQVVALYRASAKTFEEAAATDLMTAGQKYGEQLGALALALNDYGAAAVVVCPAFADVVTIDQTQIGL